MTKNPVGRPHVSVAINRAKFKKLRFEKGLLQRDIAKMVGYCDSRITQFERGHTGVPVDALKKIADLFDVDYKTLLAEEE